jgi:shikimate dehydrogenase
MPDRYVLIGENVSKSPTPRMMEAAFLELGVDAVYQSSNVKASELDSTFAELKESDLRGANVTIPHKMSIVRLLDSLDEVSSKIRAVNTIKEESGKYRGFNTDVDGIVGPLRSRGISRVRRAVVLGTGGAARAFCQAMHMLGCANLLVIYRSQERAAGFISAIRDKFPDIMIESASTDALPDWEPDLLFNASPAGVDGLPLPVELDRLLEGGSTAFDAVYFPVDTELVRLATELGCRVVYGHEMLLHQALKSFQIWTGRAPPVDAMSRVLHDALGVIGRR